MLTLTDFLDRHNALTLAYTDATGPGACAVWYARTTPNCLVFLSALNTRHGAALQTGGRVAFTVHKDEQDWRGITGVQGTGRCAPLAPDAASPVWGVYVAKFPFVSAQFPELEAALRRTAIWMIEADWIRLVDNSVRFGHKTEWRF